MDFKSVSVGSCPCSNNDVIPKLMQATLIIFNESLKRHKIGGLLAQKTGFRGSRGLDANECELNKNTLYTCIKLSSSK